MPQTFVLPRQMAVDDDANPLAGALAYFFETGTTTPQAVYVDASLTTPHENPVVADSAGRWPKIYLNSAATANYRVRLTTAGGVQIDQQDDIDRFTVSQAEIATAINPRTLAEIAVVVTPSNLAFQELNPARYATLADWKLVYSSVSALPQTYPDWYRVDHALHPSLSNAIAGYGTFIDSDKTGTVCYRNTVFGALAMQVNGSSVTAGGSNSAFGFAALQHAIESSGNTAVGGFALNQCTGVNSSHNNGFGYRSLASLTTGTQNNVLGFQAGDLLVIGDNNHAFGENAMSHLLSGIGNHYYGYQAGYTKVGGNHSHGWGYQALFSENASNITGITKAASAVITVSTVLAINPFSVGQPVCIRGVSGMTEINDLEGFVSAIGGSSGAWTVTVNINSSSFTTYTSGGYLAPVGNVVFGHRVGFNILSRGGNTIMGYDACQGAEPGYGNTVAGFQAAQNVNANAGGDGGALNSIFGFWSARQITTGASNACFGQRSGESLTTGSENVCVGPNSGNGVSTASRTVNVGSTTSVNLNGANNTNLGYNAGSVASAQTYTNTTNLGANAVPTASNQVNIGDTSVTAIRAQVTSITGYSDRNLKKNIRPLDIPDEALDEIEVVVFEWAGSNFAPGEQVGVIAQQLDEWQQKWGLEWLGLVDKTDPNFLQATPGKLLLPLLLKTQRLSKRVAALEAN